MRHPIVAGQFYKSTGLDEQLKQCFLSKFGPGLLPAKANKKILGIISPHAGYMFSGPCAAFGYKELAESDPCDTYVLIGLSHSGYGTCISNEDWKTPLGIAKVDSEFQLNLGLPIDEEAHSSEHSIEVQLPFLQHIKKDYKIAPIIASPDVNYSTIAESILKAAKKTKRSIQIIASSDFTHYGLNYGFMPFSDNIKENLYKLDNGAIAKILSLDAKGFLDYVKSTGATVCGQYPIAVLLAIAKNLGAKKATLLKYYTSADIIGDYSSAVGYASIKI